MRASRERCTRAAQSGDDRSDRSRGCPSAANRRRSCRRARSTAACAPHPWTPEQPTTAGAPVPGCSAQREAHSTAPRPAGGGRRASAARGSGRCRQARRRGRRAGTGSGRRRVPRAAAPHHPLIARQREKARATQAPPSHSTHTKHTHMHAHTHTRTQKHARKHTEAHAHAHRPPPRAHSRALARSITRTRWHGVDSRAAAAGAGATARTRRSKTALHCSQHCCPMCTPSRSTHSAWKPYLRMPHACRTHKARRSVA